MRRVKGLVFLAVLAMMVFGLVAVGSAATFSDAGNYAEPVSALNALKIVDGYPDGTIKPDQPITRAEFAKVVVMELGLNADIAPATTQFSDVDSTHWAGGMINVAVGQGIIKGYPDGTFRPDANVTYAEAITMLVRMLGYAPSIDESTWPAGYLAKAATTGVADGVRVKADEAATRGDVFRMAYNALDADVMLQTGWGTEIVFEESKDFEDTILYDKLDVDRVGDEDDTVRIIATPRVSKNLDKDQVEVDPVKNNSDYDADVLDIIANANFDVNNYLGYEAECWLNDDDEVIFIKSHTSANDIVKGVVDGWDGSKLEMANGKKYDFADEVYAYMNGAEVANPKAFVTRTVDGDDYTVPTWLGRNCTIILDEGEIAFIEAIKGESLIVESVDVDDETIKYYFKSDSKATLDLSDNDDYVVVRDGVNATLADIEEGDIIRTVPNIKEGADEDDVKYIQVSSQKVEGTVEEVGSESSEVSDYYLVIDGEKYSLAGDVFENDYYLPATVTITTDDNDTIDEVTINDLEDLLGEDVTLSIFAGTVRHIMSGKDSDSEDDLYMVLPQGNTEFNSFEGLRFKFVNKNGDNVTYYATDDTEFYEDGDINEYDTDSEKQIVENTYVDNDWIVRITLDNNGDLDEFEAVVKMDGDTKALVADDDSDRLKIDGKWYALDDNVALFEKSGDDFDDASWKSMQDTENLGEGYAYVDTDNEVKAIVVLEQISSDADRGIVTAKSKTKDGYKLTLLVNGESVTYETDGDSVVKGKSYVGDNEGSTKTTSSVAYINKGDVVSFELNASDEIDEITELEPYEDERWEVMDIDSKGKILTLSPNVDEETNEAIEVTVVVSDDSDPDDASYYFDFENTTQAPKAIDFGDISEGDIVQVFMFEDGDDNEGQVQFIKIVD
ncbi:MAG: Surface layer protein precursor [Pelotomaculum sp. PtaB.Bin104]|nr:MAG: Surface layer protein precursor [Pelotomaculum sp. PtaB.Bin104]